MLFEILILLFILPIATVGLSLLYEKCMESGMIFRRWYLFLMYIHITNWRKKDRWKRVMIKPLYCLVCSNTWLGIIFSLIYFNDITATILYVGIQYIYLELIIRLIN